MFTQTKNKITLLALVLILILSTGSELTANKTRRGSSKSAPSRPAISNRTRPSSAILPNIRVRQPRSSALSRPAISSRPGQRSFTFPNTGARQVRPQAPSRPTISGRIRQRSATFPSTGARQVRISKPSKPIISSRTGQSSATLPGTGARQIRIPTPSRPVISRRSSTTFNGRKVQQGRPATATSPRLPSERLGVTARSQSTRSRKPNQSRIIPNTRSRGAISRDTTILNRRGNTPLIRQSKQPSSRYRDLGLRRDQSSLSRRHKNLFDNLSSSRIRSSRERSDYHDKHRREHLHYRYRDYPSRKIHPSRKIFHWLTWPSCCRPICYTYGPCYTFGYFWPYYHRKFVFVSLGGYWPCYTYRRYYWYGWHPYTWYGDYIPGHVVVSGPYNYYYYNEPLNYDALSEARKRLEQKPLTEPEEATQADHCFEAGVKSFEAGNYADAIAWFDNALELAPDDIILPFAYIQALFANGEYKKATEVLRTTLSKAPPEEGVFYPKGLYPDDNVLNKQIKQLSRAVRLNPLDDNLQLLLGYQLLGMSRLDEAVEPLQKAQQDSENHQAATLLMSLLEKLKNADEK